MKKCAVATLALAALLLMSGALASAQGPTTRNYANLALSSPSASESLSGVWDLTQGDLTISYTIDLTGIASREPDLTSWTSVGLMNCDGYKGWMESGAPNSWETDPDSLDIDDKHALSTPGSIDERSYDATDPNTVIYPFGTWVNYGIWFDRDGVDQWQAVQWGNIDGQTYNTGGTYDIVINYHAISSTVGTMQLSTALRQVSTPTAGRTPRLISIQQERASPAT